MHLVFQQQVGKCTVACGRQDFLSCEQLLVCSRVTGIPCKFMRVGSVENIGNRPAGQYICRLLRHGAGLGYLYHSLCFGVKIVKRFQAPSLFGASHRFTRFFISSPKPPFFRQPVPLPASHTRKGGQQKPKRPEDPKKTPRSNGGSFAMGGLCQASQQNTPRHTEE